MKLRTTLFAGFLGMAGLTFIIGLTTFIMSNSTLKAKDNVIALSDVEADLLNAVGAHNEWKATLEEAFLENQEEVEVQFDGHECGFGNWYYKGGLDSLEDFSPEAANIIRGLEVDHLQLHESAIQIDENWKKIHPGLGEELFQRLSDHNAWATSLMKDILQGKESDVEIDHTQCGFGKFLDSEWNRELEAQWPEYRQIMEPVKIEHAALHQAVIEINRVDDIDDKYSLFQSEVDPRLQVIEKEFKQVIALESSLVDGQSAAKDLFDSTTLPLLESVKSGIIDTIVEIGNKKVTLEEQAKRLNLVQSVVIWIGIILGVCLGILVAVLIIRWVFKKLGGEPDEISEIAEKIAEGNLILSFDKREEVGCYASMKKMANNLTEIVGSVLSGSEQIASASEQLASGNQDLSNRTEQQASSLEETSAAIEEMNASIKSNADNTITTDQLAREASQKSEDGSQTISEMVVSMDEISVSSNRIADIIEVITNIAFQTNLLALNASIEAARAGEQGKGFAVVAVEVRKLAKRSDKAANEITEIIKNSNEKVSEGVEIANKAGVVLNDIKDSVKKVTTLVGEIAAATQEQLSSAGEIDKTLSNLDENTQKNAALVEEAASATEELSAQAQELNSSMQFFTLDDSSKSQQKAKTQSTTQLIEPPKTKSAVKSSESYETFSDLVDEGQFDEF